jgi:AraC-like DNA-binding protein
MRAAPALGARAARFISVGRRANTPRDRDQEPGHFSRASPGHFCQALKSYRELLEEVREALAEELLSARQLNVDEIASRLGYSDRSAFTAAFKRWKGVSPKAFRVR